MTDWVAVKSEYISTDISTRDLAQKYGVTASQVQRRSAKEKWTELRAKQRSRTEAECMQKTAEVVSASQAERIALIMSGGTTAARLLCRHLEEMERSGEIRPYEIKATVEALKGVRDLYKADEDHGEDDKLNAYLEGMRHA